MATIMISDDKRSHDDDRHRSTAPHTSPRSNPGPTRTVEVVLMDMHPEAVLRLVGDRIVDANEGAADLFEQDRERLVGQHLLDLTPPFTPDGRSARELWADRLERASRAIEHAPWRCLRPDGTLVEVDLVLAVVAGPETAEPAPREARREAEAIASLAVLAPHVREARPAWRTIAQLADAMAHDLNNQLAAIDGHLELAIAEATERAELEGRFAKIRRGVRVAEAILLRFEGISHGAAAEAERLEPAALLEAVKNEIAAGGRRGPRIEVRPEAGLPAVEGVRELLEDVLQDVVVDLAAPPGTDGEVTITARTIDHDAAWVSAHPGALPGPHVRIEVAGRGPVSSAEVRAYVFDPRIARRARFREVGPTLALTCAVVKQHRGYISAAEGRSGTGIVIIDLPVAAQEASAGPNIPGPQPAEGRAGRTILLVEDEAAVRGLVASYLRDQGFDVIECVTAEEALEFYERRPAGIDLLLADLKLPGMGGVALSEQVHATRPDLKVLFTTGLGEEDVPEAKKEAGERGLLTKPYRLAQLGARVREVLES